MLWPAPGEGDRGFEALAPSQVRGYSEHAGRIAAARKGDNAGGLEECREQGSLKCSAW